MTLGAILPHLEVLPGHSLLQHLDLSRREGHPELVHGGNGQGRLALGQAVDVLWMGCGVDMGEK